MASNAANDIGNDEEGEGKATMLVSEFPPPPFYYKQAATLTPPPIPKEALERGTRRASAAAARARAEAERLRLAEAGEDNTSSVLGGIPAAESTDEDGDVVAVFGEIVEVSAGRITETLLEAIIHFSLLEPLAIHRIH